VENVFHIYCFFADGWRGTLGWGGAGQRMKDFWPFKKFNTSVFGVRYSVFKIQNIEYRTPNIEEVAGMSQLALMRLPWVGGALAVPKDC
jgi:hypothetical protein